MMKLYTTVASPFGARIRIHIVKKKIPVEIALPPGGLGSDELLGISPLGKIPILDLGESVIVESEVIQEYLQDRFPLPSLLGDTPEATANIRTLSRITDIYLVPAMQPFRSYLKEENQDRNMLHECVTGLHKVFTGMECFISGTTYAISNKLSLADCAMAPIFHYLRHFAQLSDVDIALPTFPRLNKWINTIRSDEAVDVVIKEIEDTF